MIKKSAWLAALVLSCCTSAWSAWPDKPITIIVPYAAGGLTDAVTRALTDAMGRELGQPVVVDNRAGAGGKIGMEQLKRAPKDGYTIGLAVPATMVTLPLTDPNYGISPLKDFELITVAVDTFTVLAVSKNALPSGDLKDFIAMARSKPGKLNYGTPGAGTSFHFNNVFMASKLGIDAVHVPYKGESAALTDLAGGAIDYMLAGQGAKVFVDSGRIRALAVSSKRRVSAYPDVPTFKELGIDFTTDGWVGYVAPAGVPAVVVDRLNSAFVKAIRSPEVQRSFASMGYEPVGSSRQEFRSIVEGASRRYADILRTGAVKLTP
ncbi:MAG: tripartite tricarboxylate transporter substrate binding protein [Polaromonas sp.]